MTAAHCFASCCGSSAVITLLRLYTSKHTDCLYYAALCCCVLAVVIRRFASCIQSQLICKARSECGLTDSSAFFASCCGSSAVTTLLRLSVFALSAAASSLKVCDLKCSSLFGNSLLGLSPFGCLLRLPSWQQCCHHSSSSVLVTIGTPEELRLPITVVSTQLEDRARVVFDIHLRA